MTLDLDDLFREARAAMKGQKAATTRKKEDAPPDNGGLYKDPANWRKGKGVALLHQKTGTLLGNFTEYTHRTVQGARRLIRENDPPPVQSVEYIDLDLACSNGEPATPKRAWQTTLSLTAPITLLGAKAPTVSLLAHFGEGNLLWIELAEATLFQSADGLIRLPAGTNILPELTPGAVRVILQQLNQPVASCQ